MIFVGVFNKSRPSKQGQGQGVAAAMCNRAKQEKKLITIIVIFNARKIITFTMLECRIHVRMSIESTVKQHIILNPKFL